MSSATIEFADHHNLTIPDWIGEDTKAIEWLQELKTSVDTDLAQHCNRLLDMREPSWAMLNVALDRVFEHASATITCYLTGNWASLEVVSRAVMESASTVLYISEKDRAARLGQYLTHYFTVSRKAIERSEPSCQAKAQEHLLFRENVVRQVATNEGIPFEAVGWPTQVIQRFQGAGMELDYRHLYTVLSGEAHNDAGSLIDLIVHRALSGANPKCEALGSLEVQYWMRFYLYFSIQYYAAACHAFTSAFELVPSMGKTQCIRETIADYLGEITANFQDTTSKIINA